MNLKNHKRNTWIIFLILVLAIIFSDMTQKVQQQSKYKQVRLHHINKLLYNKENNKLRKHRMQENIRKYIADKTLISQVYRNSDKSKTKTIMIIIITKLKSREKTK